MQAKPIRSENTLFLVALFVALVGLFFFKWSTTMALVLLGVATVLAVIWWLRLVWFILTWRG